MESSSLTFSAPRGDPAAGQLGSTRCGGGSRCRRWLRKDVRIEGARVLQRFASQRIEVHADDGGAVAPELLPLALGQAQVAAVHGRAVGGSLPQRGAGVRRRGGGEGCRARLAPERDGAA